jgi:stage II sporulation protein D
MLRRLALSLVATAVTALIAPPAQAAPDHDRREPASITVTTLGNGHGKGLSQYGAYHRAKDVGQTYREIVEHYYPNTAWGTAGGTIRVLLTAAPEGSVVVAARSGLKAHSLGNGRTWTLPTKRDGKTVKKWRVTPAGARSLISYRTTSWRDWKKPKGDAELSAGNQPLTLDGGPTYRGAIRLTDAGAVNVLGLDTYLRGVLSQEVFASWPADAIRSQAVAARTYAVFERGNVPAGRDYDLCDTAACQMYGGVGAETSATDAAVKATAGEILTYDGAPIFAQFSASNGGYSVDGGYPYLVAEEDPYDHGYPDDPHATTFTGDQVTRHWTGLGDLVSVEVTERDGNGPNGGRVTEVLVTGTEGSVHATGSQFRSYLGLRSTLFTVS